MGFKIGDIVIALTDKLYQSSQTLNYFGRTIIVNRMKGQEYKVVGVTSCKKCNSELICVHEQSLSFNAQMKCMDCGCISLSSNSIWSMASNFKAKEYDPYEELMLAVKLEDYERAAELRDLINADHERQRN